MFISEQHSRGISGWRLVTCVWNIDFLSVIFKVWSVCKYRERWHGFIFQCNTCGWCCLSWYSCIYHSLLYLYTICICIIYIHYTIFNIYTIYFPIYMHIPIYICMSLYIPPCNHTPPYIHIPPNASVPSQVHAPPHMSVHPLFVCITVGLSYSWPASLLVTCSVLYNF